MDQPTQQPTQSTSTSGMAIAALVLGILAILTSFLPIINNGSFFLAALGLIFAIVGFVGIRKGKKKGNGIAIAGIVLNVISIIVVLATQSMYSAAIDSATNGPEASVTVEAESDDSTASTSAADSTTDLAVGTSITTEGGLVVSVDAVQTGLKNYNGDPITGITVTYANNGSKELSFNSFDWKAEDANGAQRSNTYYSESDNELNSGTLAAGGTVTGDVYFDGNATKALYYASMISDKPTASWLLG